MVRRFIKFFEKQPKKVFLGQQHVWEEAVHGVLTLDRGTIYIAPCLSRSTVGLPQMYLSHIAKVRFGRVNRRCAAKSSQLLCCDLQ